VDFREPGLAHPDSCDIAFLRQLGWASTPTFQTSWLFALPLIGEEHPVKVIVEVPKHFLFLGIADLKQQL
jgi:hypothetical protein